MHRRSTCVCCPFGYVNSNVAEFSADSHCWACSDSHSSFVAAACPVYNSVTRVSSLGSDLPASGEGPSVPDEVSPLLKPKRTHAHRQTISERWRAARSSFLDDNLGLLLVAASQFFFSAMGTAVKWFNSSDDPVPTLVVCMTHGGRIFSARADFSTTCAVDTGPNGT